MFDLKKKDLHINSLRINIHQLATRKKKKTRTVGTISASIIKLGQDPVAASPPGRESEERGTTFFFFLKF
jgi:hypothetical protein